MFRLIAVFFFGCKFSLPALEAAANHPSLHESGLHHEDLKGNAADASRPGDLCHFYPFFPSIFHRSQLLGYLGSQEAAEASVGDLPLIEPWLRGRHAKVV